MAGRRHTPPARPRIYGGDETKARAAVKRYITKAEGLLDQAVGVRKQYDAAIERWNNPKAQRERKQEEEKRERERQRVRERAEREWAGLDAASYLLEPIFPLRLVPREPDLGGVAVSVGWDADFQRFASNSGKAMRSLLQEKFEDVLPVLASHPPRDHEEREEWLRGALDELRQLQAVLGVQRNIEPIPPAATPFAELHSSGLVEENVIRDHTKSMAAQRTPKQLNDAIGSVKELTEATLRGALDQLGQPARSRDDLSTLMKAWRLAIVKPAAPSPGGADALVRALNADVAFLSEWRNRYGRGHGRTKYPAGVRPRHARLATDAAERVIRFVVTTMDDLELLPP